MFVDDGSEPLSPALPRDKINACRDRYRLETQKLAASIRFSLRGQRHERHEWFVGAHLLAPKHAAAVRFR